MKTSLGYRTFRCAAGTRRCNERSGTPFDATRARVPGVPTDVVFLVVLWRLRYTLSLRDLAEMFLERGFSMRSDRRDMDAARRFFARSLEVVGHAPEKVTTDGHAAYPRAIREILGEGVTYRCSQYVHNRIEQDHRGIKERYQPMRGFRTFCSAARFCSAHDELRDYSRHRTRMHEMVPSGAQRERLRARLTELGAMIEAA